MNLAHIHIVLNHVPSLGSMLALVLLAAATVRKDDALKKFSFYLLVLVALSTLPTYLSGNGARRMVVDQPSASLGMVEVHQNAAMLTLIAMTITGTFAWFALWELRRTSKVAPLTSLGTLLSTAVTAGLIFLTGSLGGKINHPEIRTEAEAALTQEGGWRAKVEEFMANAWAWPTAEAIHFTGMVALFGVSLLLLLRMLGFMKSIPFSGIHRLLPLAVLGFILNVLTGMMFFIAQPGSYVGKQGFLLKILCTLLAALPVIYFTVFDAPWQTGANVDASTLTKVAAVCAFTFLLGVIVFGRLLPFFN